VCSCVKEENDCDQAVAMKEERLVEGKKELVGRIKWVGEKKKEGRTNCVCGKNLWPELVGR
jgi:hypothetical protein